MTSAPGGLPTRIGAEPASSTVRQRDPAHRAPYRNAIVTRRGSGASATRRALRNGITCIRRIMIAHGVHASATSCGALWAGGSLATGAAVLSSFQRVYSVMFMY